MYAKNLDYSFRRNIAYIATERTFGNVVDCYAVAMNKGPGEINGRAFANNITNMCHVYARRRRNTD